MKGKRKLALLELKAIRYYLKVDVNKVLGIEFTSENNLILCDEFNMKVNCVIVGIPKYKRIKFLEALGLIASCFVKKRLKIKIEKKNCNIIVVLWLLLQFF